MSSSSVASNFESKPIEILLSLVTVSQFLLLGIATKPPTVVPVLCLNSDDVNAFKLISFWAFKFDSFISISLF